MNTFQSHGLPHPGAGVTYACIALAHLADALHTSQPVQSVGKLCKPRGYEAAASSRGAPIMPRNLSSNRDSSLETCIWLMPSSWAMSDCERCSK